MPSQCYQPGQEEVRRGGDTYRVSVSVSQVLRGREPPDTAVAVGAVVVGTGDLAKVGGLVEGGGSLVLSVASARKGGQGAEVQRAVHHVRLRRQRVRQDCI